MKIVRNYFYNILYQLLNILIPIMTIPYISRVLGPSGIGINSYTNSIISYFVLLANLGVNLYGNRMIALVKSDKKRLSIEFFEIYLSTLIFSLFSYALFWFFFIFFSNHSRYLIYQSILIVAAMFDISWFFMGLEDFKKTVLRNSIVKIIMLFSIFLFVKNHYDIGTYILILAISQLVGNLSLWPYLRKIIEPINLNKLHLLRHFRPLMSYFFPQIAVQIYVVFNKTLLGILSNMTAVGYFENSDKVLRVILAFLTATGTVMLPRITNISKGRNSKRVIMFLESIFDFIASLAFPICFGIIGIANNFSMIFFGKSFSGISLVICLMAPITIFIPLSNVSGTQFLIPMGKVKYYTLSVTLGAIANIIMNLLMIPLWKVYGAALSSSFSELVVMSVQFYVIKNDLKLNNMLKICIKYFIASCIMCLTTIIVGQYLGGVTGLILQVITGILVYLLICILEKVTVVNSIKFILNEE